MLYSTYCQHIIIPICVILGSSFLTLTGVCLRESAGMVNRFRKPTPKIFRQELFYHDLNKKEALTNTGNAIKLREF